MVSKTIRTSLYTLVGVLMLLSFTTRTASAATIGDARTWATNSGATWMPELESAAQAVAAGSRDYRLPKGDWLVWAEGVFGGVSAEEALARLGEPPAEGSYVAAYAYFDGAAWNAGYVVLTPMSSPTTDVPKPAKPAVEKPAAEKPTVEKPAEVKPAEVKPEVSVPERVDETQSEPVTESTVATVVKKTATETSVVPPKEDTESSSEIMQLEPQRASTEPQTAWMYLLSGTASVLFVGKLVRSRNRRS